MVPGFSVTSRPDWNFDPATARAALFKHFGVSTLAGFGFDDDQPCLIAAGALLLYLQETLRASLAHLSRLRPLARDRLLFLDEVTRRGLELTRTLRDGDRAGSLLAVLDRTVTAMGARLLQECILSPLADRPQIEARLDAVGEFVLEHALRQRAARRTWGRLRSATTDRARQHRPSDAARSGSSRPNTPPTAAHQGESDRTARRPTERSRNTP